VTTDHLILDSSRLPATIRVGDHVELKIRAHVRRIEAEEIDVGGYDADGANAVLHGQTEVELTIESIGPA
jgi:hypothetical protein